MADDSNDEGSIGSLGTKKKSKGAFGSSSNSKPVYSDYAHISNESDVAFARYLAATKNSNAGPEEKDYSKKKVRARVEVDDGIAKVDGADESLPSCEVKDCKLILKALLDIQEKNAHEKADLEQKLLDQDIQYEEMLARYSSLEQSLHMLQAEESRLDDEKAAAKAKYAAYEKQKLDLAIEKESFAGRSMVAETERAAAFKDLRAAQKALADAMWRGKRTYGDDDDDNSISSLASSMKIRRSGRKQIDDDNSLAAVTYTSQARSSVTDVMELTYRLPSKPYFVLAKLALDNHDERIKNMRYGAPGNLSAAIATDPSFDHLTSPINTVRSRRRIAPVSNGDRLRRVRSRSPDRYSSSQSLGSYKGYTPCGLQSPRKMQQQVSERQLQHRRSIMKDPGLPSSSSSYYGGNYDDDNASIGDLTFNSQVTMPTLSNGSVCTSNGTVKTSHSAPGIFFSEKARRKSGRTTRVGRVRTRGKTTRNSEFGDDYFDTMLNKSLTSAGVRNVNTSSSGAPGVGRGVKFGFDDDSSGRDLD